jgi:hypothetical protein
MFEQLLRALMSGQASIRRDAEQKFDQLQQESINQTTGMLAQTFINSNIDLVLRSFSGILLRTLLEKNIKLIDPQTRAQLKAALINLWYEESNQMITRRLAHVLAQIAADSNWPELISIVIAPPSIQGLKPLQVMCLVEILTDYSPTDIQNNLDCLGNFLGQHIISSEREIRVVSARATSACIACIDDEHQRNAFRAAVGPILAVLGDCLSCGDEIDSTRIMEQLITIANIQPVFFKGFVDEIISAMLTVAQTKNLEFSTRSTAIEFIVTLAETAPALARRCERLVPGLLPLAFQFMIEREESEVEWRNLHYSEEQLEGDYIIGEETIERLTAGLGPRMVASEVLRLSQIFSSHDDWKHRRAAVAAVNRLAEGNPSHFAKQHLNLARSFLAKMVQDNSQIVIYEVVQVFHSICVLFDLFIYLVVSRRLVDSRLYFISA